MKKEKFIVQFEDPEIIEGIVSDFKHKGHIIVPEEYLDKKVKIIIVGAKNGE